jgi:hypothetical protein
MSGEELLDGVRKRTQPPLSELCDDRFEQIGAEALEVLDTDSRLPDVGRRGFPHDLTPGPQAHPILPTASAAFPGEFSLKQSNGDMVRFN